MGSSSIHSIRHTLTYGNPLFGRKTQQGVTITFNNPHNSGDFSDHYPHNDLIRTILLNHQNMTMGQNPGSPIIVSLCVWLHAWARYVLMWDPQINQGFEGYRKSSQLRVIMHNHYNNHQTGTVYGLWHWVCITCPIKHECHHKAPHIFWLKPIFHQ